MGDRLANTPDSCGLTVLGHRTAGDSTCQRLHKHRQPAILNACRIRAFEVNDSHFVNQERLSWQGFGSRWVLDFHPLSPVSDPLSQFCKKWTVESAVNETSCWTSFTLTDNNNKTCLFSRTERSLSRIFSYFCSVCLLKNPDKQCPSRCTIRGRIIPCLWMPLDQGKLNKA